MFRGLENVLWSLFSEKMNSLSSTMYLLPVPLHWGLVKLPSKHVGMSVGMIFKPVLFRQPYCWYFISTVFLWCLVGVVSQQASSTGSLALRVFLPPCLQCLAYWWFLCWEETWILAIFIFFLRNSKWVSTHSMIHVYSKEY